MGLLDALRQYISDAAPGGLLNPEQPQMLSGLLDYGKKKVNYLGGMLDPNAPISRDIAGWHGKTQLGLADLLAGREGPAADYGYQQMMNMAGVAPVGMFIGKGAKTWDAVMMGKAQELANKGTDPRAIWKETGTWQGPDGAWRQEIPDNAARWVENADIPPSVLGNSIKHSKVFAAYPDTTNIRRGFTSGVTQEKGSFNPETNMLSIDPRLSDAEHLSTSLHELQHSVQGIEGWAKGGNASSLARESQQKMDSIGGLNKTLSTISRDMDAAKEAGNKDLYHALRETYHRVLNQRSGLSDQVHIDPMDAYRRLAGEAEARATQARMPMDAAQRRATFPADSYDVPLKDLIIRR